MRPLFRKPAARGGLVTTPRLAPPRPATPEVVRILLAWFRQHGRDLPWRRTRDPYAIWISEVMLQQTQVKTVVPYWQRWMRRLPNVGRLARASIDQILRLWEGLGYYRRARHIHAAAQAIVRLPGRHLPTSAEALLELPGIGSYTAGAILSIAYNKPFPAVDGNVIRVITRLYGIKSPKRSQTTLSRINRIAQGLVRAAHGDRQLPVRPGRGRCGDLNESLMELGATICLPTKPRCDRCPLVSCCRANALPIATDLPFNPHSRPTQEVCCSVMILHHRGRFLVRQRPDSCRNAGLWEFPSSEALSPADPTPGLVNQLLQDKVDREPWLRLRHVITRHRIRLSVHRAFMDPRSQEAIRSLSLRVTALRWFTKRQLRNLPFTASHRRILRSIEEDPSP